MQYVWVMIVFLSGALSQKFKVKVPDAPVFTVPGSDVVLPCSVRKEENQNMINAVDLNVTWSRSYLTDSLVHLYGNRKDLNTGQIPSYSGRTAVFKEELKNGNVSLKLSNVQISDEGEYTCRVDSRQWYNDRSIKLSVEVIGSQPVITVESYSSGKLTLLCESKGWRPEPELEWLDSSRANLTAESTETHLVADLYNVKSRMIVHYNDIDMFFCRVTLRLHVKEEKIIYILATPPPECTYPILCNLEAHFWKSVAISVSVLLLVLLVTLGIIFSNCQGHQKSVLSPAQWTKVEFTLLPEEELDLTTYDLLMEEFWKQ